MLGKFKAGDEIICIKTSDNIGVTRGVSYEVLHASVKLGERFVEIKNDVNTLRNLNENRFILDTPKNRRKLQIFKMFELYGKEEE